MLSVFRAVGWGEGTSFDFSPKQITQLQRHHLGNMLAFIRAKWE
jgi:hypothetical protein